MSKELTHLQKIIYESLLNEKMEEDRFYDALKNLSGERRVVEKLCEREFIENSVNVDENYYEFMFSNFIDSVKYLPSNIFLKILKEDDYNIAGRLNRLYRNNKKVKLDEDFYTVEYFKNIINEDICTLFPIYLFLTQKSDTVNKEILDSILTFKSIEKYLELDNTDSKSSSYALVRNACKLNAPLLYRYIIDNKVENELFFKKFCEGFNGSDKEIVETYFNDVDPSLSVELLKYVFDLDIDENIKFKTLMNILTYYKGMKYKECKEIFYKILNKYPLKDYVYKYYFYHNLKRLFKLSSVHEVLMKDGLYDFFIFCRNVKEDIVFDLLQNKDKYNICLNTIFTYLSDSYFHEEVKFKSLVLYPNETFKYLGSVSTKSVLVRKSNGVNLVDFSLKHIPDFDIVKVMLRQGDNVTESEAFKNNKELFFFTLTSKGFLDSVKIPVIEHILANDIYFVNGKILPLKVTDLSKSEKIIYYNSLLNYLKDNVSKIHLITKNDKLRCNAVFKRELMRLTLEER